MANVRVRGRKKVVKIGVFLGYFGVRMPEKTLPVNTILGYQVPILQHQRPLGGVQCMYKIKHMWVYHMLLAAWVYLAHMQRKKCMGDEKNVWAPYIFFFE